MLPLSIVDVVITSTTAYLEAMPKGARKAKGQFFTSTATARFMASRLDLEHLPECVSILDPGAGTGILSAAVIDRINNDGHNISAVSLTCYETDPDVLPLLQSNLRTIAKLSKIPVTYQLITDDYILSQRDEFTGSMFADSVRLYHIIIANPPYVRVPRDDPHALAMPTVVHGAPNLYFLFLAMSLFNLRDGCEMVYIIPRSWTSGAYFEAFRRYLFDNGVITHIHIFASRERVFDAEQVLQETMIIVVRRTEQVPDNIIVTSSSDSRYIDIAELSVPYSTVVSWPTKYVFLPTSKSDIATIEMINRYSQTLPQRGLRMRTGIVVDFRQWDDLRDGPGEHILPLFYAQHIREGRVHHRPSSGKNFDWIVDSKPGLIQRNKNYVFCKRFTAKEERRRLQCGVYQCDDYPEYTYIGTQNKINYVDYNDIEQSMDLPTAYGVYALLNSTLFDNYYRILNGSTQVNSTEINSIPVPPLELIKEIGSRIIEGMDLSTPACDKIVMEVAYD